MIKTTTKNVKKYGDSNTISSLNPIFLGLNNTFLWKDHDKKYIKPILKNSTGDNEIPGNLIHLLAPPEAVTIDAGKNGIIIINRKNVINKAIPTFPTILSGSVIENHHIINIATIPTPACLIKK
jgi:hypothetical protein